MPKKKQVEPLPESSPARLNCPACKSEISADGSALHARSKYLDELIETSEDAAKLESVVSELEKKLAAAKEELQKRAAVQTKPEGKPNVEEGKKRDGWW